MGVADLHDERPRKVTTAEWVQHMLRYHHGQFVSGVRGHRVVWAMVNKMLLEEARGKGFAVQRNVMRREGFRLRGVEALTRAGLRRMMEDGEVARRLVHELMSVGRSVRSTPMQYAYEQKKLQTTVQFLSWVPPWVRRRVAEELGAGDEAELDVLCRWRVEDMVGFGRIPAYWYTLNCAYNAAYDVHRLNVGAEYGAEAVQTEAADVHAQARRDFARNCPDIVQYQIALRTELLMKVVMPALVPNS